MEDPKRVIILLGAPGAGKGTQSELLSDRLGLYLFETSKILEKGFKKAEALPKTSKERFVDVEGKKFDVLAEKENWKNGMLCSPPYVTQLVIKEIGNLFKEGESLILSGSPRTIYEVERVMPTIEELYGKANIKIIILEIKPEETIFRNSHRKICELMRHPILYNKETEKLTLCPLDGSKLEKREGLDYLDSIKVRIQEYTNRTLPMLEYFNKNGWKVDKINGEQSVSDIFKDVLKAVK